MPAEFYYYVIFFALAFGLTALITPWVVKLGQRLDIVAVPGGRRVHRGRITRIGGLALYPPFVIACLGTLFLPRQDPLETTRILGMLAGVTVVFVMGMLDDKYRLPPWAQSLALVIAVVIALMTKVFIELYNDPFTNQLVKLDWILAIPITAFWLIGMSSTVNFLDGLDGLATGVVGISAVVLFIHMLRLEQYSVAVLPLILLGCCAGFLIYNFTPARIFLGGGAYQLGFTLGALAIISGAKVATVLLVVWLPVMDVVWLIYSRWRRHQPVNLGDRGHLHMRLQDLGWPTSRIVLMYYGVTAILGAAALLISSRLLKLAVLGSLGIAILIALAFLAHKTGDVTPTGD
ncbi:MAG: undecaprenyl/decaprenyl-phosphate alpha-N-acetylglucosaminyl 1-phosphate transferase [Chloroflexi bacterium]|nr:undecaprenyl/decaprenyl-phosphate alpha-N-acetylglucosaminyl 1-phosphate transferase [Chloroflexota bacterium]